MDEKNIEKGVCEICGKKIPKERLEFLPDTTTCVKCSQTKPYSSEDLLGLNIADEELPDGINMEDFDEAGGADLSVSPVDYS
jgi:hypothetical protein